MSLKDYYRLMHFPMPICVVGFATLGASLAEQLRLDLLAWTYLAILTGLCLASYSFDELHSRPLKTSIPDLHLRALGLFGFVSAFGIGVYLTLTVSLWLLPLLILVSFFVLAYNLELFNGRFHNQLSFAFSWGGLTTFGSYYLQSLSFNLTIFLVTGAMVALSTAVWSQTHRIQPHLDLLTELARTEDGEAFVQRRHIRRKLWNVTRLLCYTIFLLSLGLLFFRLGF